MVRLGHVERLSVADVPDLRRRASRDLAEVIVARAALLMPEDRRLLEAIYTDGLTALAVAQLTGDSPRSVRRRIRTLAARVLSDRFVFVMRQREHWRPTRRRVATACIVQGRPMREGARHLRLSLHVVRRQLDAVNALFEAQSR